MFSRNFLSSGLFILFSILSPWLLGPVYPRLFLHRCASLNLKLQPSVQLVTEEVKYLEDIAQEAAKVAEGGADGNNEEEEEEEDEEEDDDEGEDGFDENQDVKNEEDMIYMKNFHPTAQVCGSLSFSSFCYLFTHFLCIARVFCHLV